MSSPTESRRGPSPDVEAIPTRELIPLVRRTQSEKALTHLGCLLVLPSIVVVWGLAFQLLPEFLAVVLAGPASVLVAFGTYRVFAFTASLLFARDLRPLRRELLRRFGAWKIADYLRRDPALEPGEIRCFFKGIGLPHGSRYWLSLLFAANGETVLDWVRYRGDLLEYPVDISEQRHQPIARADRDAIRELIERTKGTGKTKFQPNVKDGFPAETTVIFGDGTVSTVVTANLCGLHRAQLQDDRIKLVFAVAQIVGELDWGGCVVIRGEEPIAEGDATDAN